MCSVRPLLGELLFCFGSVAAPAQQTNGVYVFFWLGVLVSERFREAAQQKK